MDWLIMFDAGSFEFWVDVFVAHPVALLRGRDVWF